MLHQSRADSPSSNQGLDLSPKSSRRGSPNDPSGVSLVNSEKGMKELSQESPEYEKSSSSTSIENRFNIDKFSTIKQEQSSSMDVDNEQEFENQAGHMQISSQTDQSDQQEALNMKVVKVERKHSVPNVVNEKNCVDYNSEARNQDSGNISTQRKSPVDQNDFNSQHMAYLHNNSMTLSLSQSMA